MSACSRSGRPRAGRAVGDRYVHGLKLAEIAELVGKPYQAQEKLPPGELVRKLDLVLAAAQRYIRQGPGRTSST